VNKVNLQNGVLLFLCLCAPFQAASQTHKSRLEVDTKQCIQGMLVHPTHAKVSVFDASRVPELLKLAQEFRDNSNPTNEEGPEKMLSIYSALQKKVEVTPALARVKRMPEAKYVFDIPPVQRVVVFAFGESEDELTSFAEQEGALVPGQMNRLVLNFSTEEECKGAK
jgi:hypothetical protein